MRQKLVSPRKDKKSTKNVNKMKKQNFKPNIRKGKHLKCYQKWHLLTLTLKKILLNCILGNNICQEKEKTVMKNTRKRMRAKMSRGAKIIIALIVMIVSTMMPKDDVYAATTVTVKDGNGNNLSMMESHFLRSHQALRLQIT